MFKLMFCQLSDGTFDIEEINGIVDHVDRMQAMLDKGFRLEYFDIDHPTFKNNLLFLEKNIKICYNKSVNIFWQVK